MKLELKQIPQESGIYFFLDSGRAKTFCYGKKFARSDLPGGKSDLGRILYIGKAANLRSRLKSYFDSRPKNARIAKMLELANKVKWEQTDSEIEALILESQLIKKHKPAFNIMLRDDKQYFYVGFTDEKFPRIFLTHQIQDTKYKILNTKFVGPFTDGGALRMVLKLIRRIFPYCSCKQKHNNYCLNYHIGKCPGFCCLKDSPKRPVVSKIEPNRRIAGKKEYEKNIRAIKEILSGKKTSLIKKFEKEMAELAQKEDFEKAAELRDKIEKLKKVFENARIISRLNLGGEVLGLMQKSLRLPKLPIRIEGYDISNIQGKFATGSMVVFTNGQPDKNEYRKFKIKLSGQNDTAMLHEILIRRFSHPEWRQPDLILVDGGKAQLNAARAAVSSKILIIALTKNDRHRGNHVFTTIQKTPITIKNLPEQVRNLILHIDSEAHRFAISYYRKIHRRLIES